jgi:hypothetical protein
MCLYTFYLLTSINTAKLILYDDKLEGALPTELGHLTRLGALLPQFIVIWLYQHFENLTFLFFPITDMISLHQNEFTSTLPSKIGRLTALSELRNSICSIFLSLAPSHCSSFFSALLSPSLPTFISLASVLLQDNELTGNIPSEIGQLVNLSTLLLLGMLLF